jgi:hypothetical protein
MAIHARRLTDANDHFSVFVALLRRRALESTFSIGGTRKITSLASYSPGIKALKFRRHI